MLKDIAGQIRAGLLVAFAFVMVGCVASKPQAPIAPSKPAFPSAPAAPESLTPPTAPDPVVINPRSLMAMARALPGRPAAPRGRPLLTRISLEDYVNKKVTFEGTAKALVGKGSDRVGVLSASAANTSKASDAASRCVSDVLFLQLQKSDVPIVEREYEKVLLTDAIRIKDGFTEVGSLKEMSKEIGARFKCKYVIFVHAVVDNSKNARAQKFALPYRILDKDWQAFRGVITAYQQAYKSYASSYASFNESLKSFIEGRAKAILDSESEWQLYNSAFDNFIEGEQQRWQGYGVDYGNYQKAHNRVWERYLSDYKDYRSAWSSYSLAMARIKERPSGLQGQVMSRPPSLTRPARRSKNPPRGNQRFVLEREKARPKVRAPKSDYQKIVETLTALLANRLGLRQQKVRPAVVFTGRKQDFIPPERDVSDIGTVYKFAISIRVVDVSTSKAEWFGYAECQNLVYLSAVRECCAAIVKKLVKP
jgi:hypothetical protein